MGWTSDRDAADPGARATNHLLRAALRGHAPAARASASSRRLLHRHRRRPSGLRQRVVRVLSARLARHHGRAQSLARAAERGGAAARHPRPVAGRRRARRGDLLPGRGLPRPLDHRREPRPGRAERVRQALAGDDHAGHDLAALCEQHAPGAIDFLKIDVEGAERDGAAGGDWRRFRPKVVVLEALAPVTWRRPGEAWEPLLTAQRLSLRLLRQPQPLLRRRGARRSRGAARRGAAVVRRRRSSSASSSQRSTTPRTPTTAWPACSPAPTWCGCRCCRPTRWPSDSPAALIRRDLDRPARRRRHRRRPPAAVRQRRPRRTGPRASRFAQRHDPRSLSQCGRQRAVPGRLRAHLGQLRLVTVPSHQALNKPLWLAACIGHSL